MSLASVKALTFDTGGTILDWHSGVKGALAETGPDTGSRRTGLISPTSSGAARSGR